MAEHFRISSLSSMVIFALVSHLVPPSSQSPLPPCSPATCELPDCFCAGSEAPGGLKREKIPQMVLFTFVDAVNEQVNPYYEELFPSDRLNPNGCPVSATFFLSHNWTDYRMVKELYLAGHEIASHSVTHRMPQEWWTYATYETLEKEMSGQKDNIMKFASIPGSEIVGMRVPFLELAGDNQFQLMQDDGFVYDSTMMTGPHDDGGLWPFTLQHPPPFPYACSNYNCPKGSFPGVWEIPLNRWFDNNGQACAMTDTCKNPFNTKEEVLSYLWRNFYRHYNGNRSPVGVNLRAVWLQKDHHFQAMLEFVEMLALLHDVYMVSGQQLIEWMKDPQELKDLTTWQPWKTSCEERKLVVSSVQENTLDSEGEGGDEDMDVKIEDAKMGGSQYEASDKEDEAEKEVDPAKVLEENESISNEDDGKIIKLEIEVDGTNEHVKTKTHSQNTLRVVQSEDGNTKDTVKQNDGNGEIISDGTEEETPVGESIAVEEAQHVEDSQQSPTTEQDQVENAKEQDPEQIVVEVETEETSSQTDDKETNIMAKELPEKAQGFSKSENDLVLDVQVLVEQQERALVEDSKANDDDKTKILQAEIRQTEESENTKQDEVTEHVDTPIEEQPVLPTEAVQADYVEQGTNKKLEEIEVPESLNGEDTSDDQATSKDIPVVEQSDAKEAPSDKHMEIQPEDNVKEEIIIQDETDITMDTDSINPQSDVSTDIMQIPPPDEISTPGAGDKETIEILEQLLDKASNEKVPPKDTSLPEIEPKGTGDSGKVVNENDDKDDGTQSLKKHTVVKLKENEDTVLRVTVGDDALLGGKDAPPKQLRIYINMEDDGDNDDVLEDGSSQK